MIPNSECTQFSDPQNSPRKMSEFGHGKVFMNALSKCITVKDSLQIKIDYFIH